MRRRSPTPLAVGRSRPADPVRAGPVPVPKTLPRRPQGAGLLRPRSAAVLLGAGYERHLRAGRALESDEGADYRRGGEARGEGPAGGVTDSPQAGLAPRR